MHSLQVIPPVHWREYLVDTCDLFEVEQSFDNEKTHGKQRIGTNRDQKRCMRFTKKFVKIMETKDEVFVMLRCILFGLSGVLQGNENLCFMETLS